MPDRRSSNILERVYLSDRKLPGLDLIDEHVVDLSERAIFRLWQSEVCPQKS